jgi:hypothetical protein
MIPSPTKLPFLRSRISMVIVPLFSTAAKKEKKLESNRIPLNLHAPPADDTFDLLAVLPDSGVHRYFAQI